MSKNDDDTFQAPADHTGLIPYALEFEDGYYSVRQCRNMGDAYAKAASDYGDRRIVSVRKL